MIRVHSRSFAAGFFFLALAVLSGCRRNRAVPFDGWAFVACAGDSAVSAVDLVSFAVRQRIPLRSRPAQILSDPARNRLYVLGEGGAAGLTVIDSAALQVARTISLGDQPLRLRLSAGDARLYVLEARPPRLGILDLAGPGPPREIPLGGPPVDFDLSPDGRWAAVTLATGHAAVADLASGRVTASVAVGDDPGPIAIRYDGRQAFVANRASRSVSVLDFPAGRLITHLALGARPGTLFFKPDGGELFVSAVDRSMVVIIAAYRDEIDQPLPAGVEPGAMASTRDNALLFVANAGAGTVSVIDINDRRTLAAVPVGNSPRRLVLTPDDQWALVLNHGSGDMALIRRRTVEQGRERIRPLFNMIPVGREPVDVAVVPR